MPPMLTTATTQNHNMDAAINFKISRGGGHVLAFFGHVYGLWS
jgi:hypothetical protein